MPTTRAKLSSLSVLAVFLSAGQAPNGITSNAATKEDDIREAVLRFQIRNHDKTARICFVRIKSGDPSASFLARFSGSERPVKNRSEARIDSSGLVVDKNTGTRGVILAQDEIRRIDENALEVNGNYLCGSLCGAGGTYQLRREGEHWVVAFKASRIY